MTTRRPWEPPGNLEAIFEGGFRPTSLVPPPPSREAPLGAALAYAALGWRVLPVHSVEGGRCSCGQGCDSPGKHPRTPHGVRDATIDHGAIHTWWERWPDANVGIATGRASGIWVLDVDPRNGGDASLDALEHKLGQLPDTIEQLTGGGGRHLLFAYPDDGRVRQGNHRLGTGLDVKSDGGYIVAEPSRHATGAIYAWEASSDPLLGGIPVATPPALIARIANDIDRDERTGDLDNRRLADRKVAGIRSALAPIPACDYDTWIEMGMALHSTGAGRQAFGLWTEWSQTSAKYDPAAQARKWSSFDGHRGITLSTLFAVAKRRGWTEPHVAPPRVEAAAGERPQRILLSASELVARAKAPDFLVDGLKEADTLGVEFGGWGSGKSVRAMDEACRIALGLPVHGRAVRQGPVIYILGEGHGGVARRLVAWQIRNGHSLERARLRFSICGVPVLDDAAVTGLRAELEELTDQWDEPPAAIYLDTLARNFGPGDENKASDMQRFVDAVDRQLRLPFGACVTVIHHTGHLEKGRARGGSSLPAAADWEYRIERPQDEVVRMVCTKTKDFIPPEPLAYRLVTVPLELDGQVVESITVEPADWAPPATDELTNQPRQLLILLKDEHARRRTNLAGAGHYADCARITLQEWRELAVQARVVTAHRNSFNRAREVLETHGLVEIDNGFAYPTTRQPTDPPAA